MFCTSAIAAASRGAVLPTQTPALALARAGGLPDSASLLRKEDFFQSWVLQAICGVGVGDPVTGNLVCFSPAHFGSLVTGHNMGPQLQGPSLKDNSVLEARHSWQLLKEDQDNWVNFRVSL